MAPRVLIVEDNEPNRILIKVILEHLGYDIRIAMDGASGVAAAKEYLPDVVLMDIQMPVTDGLTAAKLLKADPATAGIRLIALTSFAMEGDRERCLGAGFDDYIAKPIDTRALPEIVARHVKGTGNAAVGHVLCGKRKR